MTTSLDRFIDPANYHPDAVANAGKGAVAEIDPNLLIIRLGTELHRGNRAGAEEAIMRLEGDDRGGHDLFQMMTGKLILALWTKDDAVIMAALKAWLDARRPLPHNWFHELLDAPELARHVAKLDPAELALPGTKLYRVTEADRAIVKDLEAARVQAVTENLQWLREMGITGTVKAMAKTYRITHANQHLREITLSGKDDWPDLIVAADENGAVLGSFIAH